MRESLRTPGTAVGLLALLIVGIVCSSCSSAISTHSQSTSPSTAPKIWTSPNGAFSVAWTGGDVHVKATTLPVEAVQWTTYSNVVESLPLVEHVVSEPWSAPASLTGALNGLTAACLGTLTSWQGYPAVQCSGSYRPVTSGRTAIATIQQLGITKITDAKQDVLMVRNTPTHLFIVDAVSRSRAGLAMGGDFVRSFHIAIP